MMVGGVLLSDLVSDVMVRGAGIADDVWARLRTCCKLFSMQRRESVVHDLMSLLATRRFAVQQHIAIERAYRSLGVAIVRPHRQVPARALGITSRSHRRVAEAA